MANPVIVGVDGDNITFTENDALMPVSPDASATDGDSADFEGGTLTVAFSGGVSGDNDRLALINGPSISVDENTILDSLGVVIGYVSGGTDPQTPLVVTFTADADAGDVAAVMQAVSFGNGSDDPVAGIRNLTFVLTDGDGGTSAPASATVDVIAVDEPPVAADDAIIAVENLIREGDLFANNGSGNDLDPDGPPLTITAVNGSAALVGADIALASGAKLRVNADGTFSYDPNGKFDHLITAEKAALTGALFLGPFLESFTYELSGLDTATVSLTVEPVDGPGDQLLGDSGNGTYSGTADPDLFILDQGGDDGVTGGGSDDIFYFGTAFTNADSVDGGDGEDSVILRGDYDITFDANDLVEVERVGFDSEPGDLWDVALRTVDENVAAGRQLQINAANLKPGQILTFDGAAETDGSFLVLGGSGNDRITGGGGDDMLNGGAGFDELHGGGGNDALNGGRSGNDRLDGGTGADTMTGGTGHDTYVVDSGGDVVVELGQGGTDIIESSVTYRLPTHVEWLILTGGFSRDGRGNSGDNRLFGNGGNNLLNGGKGDDRIDGGAGNDRIYGSEGSDMLTGGAGRDGFFFNTAPGPGNVDRILDFDADDVINLARYAFTKVGPLGTLNASAFVLGTSAADGNDRILYDAATGDISYDPDGSGAAAAILFATVSAGTPLTHADFFIYD